VRICMIRLLMRRLRLRRSRSQVRVGEVLHIHEYDEMKKIDTNDKSHTTKLDVWMMCWLVMRDALSLLPTDVHTVEIT